MARGLASASLLENVQLNQTLIIPNAVQGIFRRRRSAVALATRLDLDGLAIGLLSRLRRNHGPGPLWVRVVRDPALLLLSVEDVQRALEGSPDPFASDPQAKRRGMAHFQPHALTISRGELWRNRRDFTEAVLDSENPVHRLGDRFVAVVARELRALLEEVDRESAGELRYDALHRSIWRIVRRIVLGDSARSDEQLTELLGDLMSEANGLPSNPSPRLETLDARLRRYVETAEEGSLAGLFAEAPHDADTRIEGQLAHWLFATGDTLSANVMRALALLAAHPVEREQAIEELVGVDLSSASNLAALSHLRACLQEAMRLYPTTPLLSRETLAELSWGGGIVPRGTQVLIPNTFLHRDPERLDYADRFAPREWTGGAAAQDWGFNHFSHGPQGCPGTNLALLLGSAIVAELLSARELRSLAPSLDVDRDLPRMLDYFQIRIDLSEPAEVVAEPPASL